MKDCEATTGSGCSWYVDPPVLECDDTAADGETGDTGTDLVLHGSGLAGQGCAAASGPLWMALVAALIVALRRAAPLAGLALLALSPETARADDVDAELMQPADGGEALSIHEANLGSRWSPSGALAWTLQSGPVVAREGIHSTALLGLVGTGTAGGSVRVADGPRVGVAMRYHHYFAVGEFEEGPGDTLLWLSVPVLEAAERGLYAAGTLEVKLPTGPTTDFLSDASGRVSGLASLRYTAQGRTLDLQVGVHLQRTQLVANLEWGPRYTWALALSARPFWYGLAALDVFGSGPLQAVEDLEASTPIEADLTAGGCLPVGLCLRLGGGAGLTYGVGSPMVRGIALLDWRPPTRTDLDGDGIPDLRDRCVRVPEDQDLLQDADGCPEDDADGDTVPDPRDLCPTVRETQNGLRDEDGCPDEAAVVVLRVVGGDGEEVETATVEGLTPWPVTVFGGDDTRLILAQGNHPWSVEAPGFLPAHGEVSAFASPTPLTVELAPLRFGRVRLTVVDAAGAPLRGLVRRRPGGEAEAAPDTEPWTVPTGPTTWSVYAAGHSSRSVSFDVRRDELLEVRVQLAPVDVVVEGDRVRSTRSISFDLDKATLRPEGAAVVDDIAALLAARPDIELLRVEGHADESGTSRHNLELSRARAAAVVEALVARGVARERLEAVGSGEARRAADTRTVDFTVLVWRDE